ncbi:hypothetical protein K432DRAFT_430401 [Lepidopterella palustris CBS 459.81]|uniref:C2H2-type domain-containing protein n=1 Tax=Lepidopterella palustris CBS 459.81 TaxID=1314670 RepID=A0A8E2J8Z4_9PEZI|nr:hypothetical protein K432DRAFT_430401 [Lepidopterella palustris CBS 459.81]
MEEWQDIPEEDRHHVEALLVKYPPHLIQRMFLEASKSRRPSTVSVSTSSGSSLYSQRSSVGSSVYSFSSNEFNPSIASSNSSYSGRSWETGPYRNGLDPNRPVPPSVQKPNNAGPSPVDNLNSESPSISGFENDFNEAVQTVIPSSTRGHSGGGSLFCTFCAERNIVKTFGMKSDWKKHESRIHETGQDWPCPVPNCSRVFDREKDFIRHHNRYHTGRPLPPVSDVKIELLPKKFFGCGFENCKTVLINWNDRCDHIAKHMMPKDGTMPKDGMKSTQWSYTTVIRNLMRQDAIRDSWKSLFSTFGEQSRNGRSQLCWHPDNTRVLRQKLECGDTRPNRDDFLMTALQLGLDLPSVSGTGASDGLVPLPKGFVTPSLDSVPDIAALSITQLEETLRGPILNSFSRFRLDPGVPSLPHSDQLSNSPHLSHSPHPSDVVMQEEHSPYDQPSFTSPENRLSFMDYTTSVDDLGLSLEPMERMPLTMDPHVTHNLAFDSSLVDPGKPTNPLTWSYPNYYDPAPLIQDSQFYSRPSLGQILGKPLRKVRSYKRSQLFQPSPNTNHPDLSMEYDVPRSNPGPMRSVRSHADNDVDPMHQFNPES